MNNQVLLRVWKSFGISAPQAEFRFHDKRKWRFDFAWVLANGHPVAVEVQGGCWTRGRHTRGAALVKEREKLNHAAALGWRVLFCSPQEAFTAEFAKLLKAALEF